MEKVLILLLLAFSLAEPFKFDFKPIASNFLNFKIRENLNNGDKCMKSEECTSGCCLKTLDLTTMPKCADKAAADEECSTEPILGIYSKCPCGSDLTCGAEKTCQASGR